MTPTIDESSTEVHNHVMTDRLTITCPCCSTELVVDRKHGDILSEKRAERQLPDFDDAFEKVQNAAAKRDEVFDQAFDRTRRQGETLAKKFEEAMKKAEDLPDGKPESPFDLD